MAKLTLNPNYLDELAAEYKLSDKTKKIVKDLVDSWDESMTEIMNSAFPTVYSGAMMQQDVDFDLVADFNRLVAESEEKRPIKVGEEVKYICDHGHFSADVLEVYEDGTVQIEYRRKDLIPPRETVRIDYLKGASDNKRLINAYTDCPTCRIPWKKSQGFHMDVWYDCPKCGAKREDVI